MFHDKTSLGLNPCRRLPPFFYKPTMTHPSNPCFPRIGAFLGPRPPILSRLISPAWGSSGHSATDSSNQMSGTVEDETSFFSSTTTSCCLIHTHTYTPYWCLPSFPSLSPLVAPSCAFCPDYFLSLCNFITPAAGCSLPLPDDDNDDDER